MDPLNQTLKPYILNLKGPLRVSQKEGPAKKSSP